MKSQIEGAPSFAYVHVELDPGESMLAEGDAMASMDAALDLKAELSGGFFSALLRWAGLHSAHVVDTAALREASLDRIADAAAPLLDRLLAIRS